MDLVEVTHRVNEEDVRSVLAELAWKGPEHLADILRSFGGGPRLFASYRDGALVGVIGIELSAEGVGVIAQIAVAPASRHMGIGQAMINVAMRDLSLSVLRAETDDDAVGFYRSCGFQVRSLGEKYPGVERYLCERQAESNRTN